MRLAILDAAGEPIGSTSYREPRADQRAVEIGWTWLTPRAWGSGANAEAKLLLLRHAFETLGCRRVEFHTDARNARFRAAPSSLPAHLDGVLRTGNRCRTGAGAATPSTRSSQTSGR